MYAIVDIETTGYSSKITEISVFLHDGKNVVDEFTSLVNPECNIPPFITNLTGISNAMVYQAPKFYEIAKRIDEITKDAVFVAHSVNFDYHIIQQEFKDLGFEFKRKKLCTVRLSRKLIPGLRSYSLGSICAAENIVIHDRHRAKGDAQATVILFEKLLAYDTQNIFFNFLNPRSGQATLPPLLAKETLDTLPQKPGVYYFRNSKNEVIYVGKAKNIRQRVMSHLYDKTKKEVNMCLETSNITFTETGSELIALLLESAEIKNIYPKFNRAQRRAQESLALFSYEDRNGIMHLAYNRLKLVPEPLAKFHNVTECRLFLEELCERFNLCPKYCHLQSKVDTCFHYQIKKCQGICRGDEPASTYNERVKNAVATLQFSSENFVIQETGRKNNELAFVLVMNGIYRGFGYAQKKKKTEELEFFLDHLQAQKDNRDTKNILRAYVERNLEKVLPFPAELTSSAYQKTAFNF